jgi:MarR family 2-MHQ and catechol resistance regulon transcriptional repressor
MTTHHKGPARERRALDVFIKLNRAYDRIVARVGQQVTDQGLTMGQFGVLEALFHLGPMNQTEIGRKLLRSGPHITMVLDHLEKRHLVTRTRSAVDRRVCTITLTAAGRELIDGIFPAHAACIADLFAGLTADEQETLGQLCKKLGTSIA